MTCLAAELLTTRDGPKVSNKEAASPVKQFPAIDRSKSPQI